MFLFPPPRKQCWALWLHSPMAPLARLLSVSLPCSRRVPSLSRTQPLYLSPQGLIWPCIGLSTVFFCLCFGGFPFPPGFFCGFFGLAVSLAEGAAKEPIVRSAFHNESFGRPMGSRVMWSMFNWLWATPRLPGPARPPPPSAPPPSPAARRHSPLGPASRRRGPGPPRPPRPEEKQTEARRELFFCFTGDPFSGHHLGIHVQQSLFR